MIHLSSVAVAEHAHYICSGSNTSDVFAVEHRYFSSLDLTGLDSVVPKPGSAYNFPRFCKNSSLGPACRASHLGASLRTFHQDS